MARRMSKATKVIQMLKHRDLGKQHYEQADLLLTSLLADSQVGDVIKLPDGRTATVMDNFANKNKVFRSHGISRFEVKIQEAGPALPE